MWHRDSDKRQLGTAVLKGDLRAARKLLERGADPNAPDPGDDITPIHYALNHGADMVQLLIDHGADVNTPGRSNETPLGAALLG
jgi:ankyrin repeat protein